MRDALMGRRIKDYDFAVEAPSYEAMKEFLSPRLIKVWQERPEFFSLRAQAALPSTTPAADVYRGEAYQYAPCDFTLCRSESDYTDGRHPDTVKPATIMTDLTRRDFTINAMALDNYGMLIDPHGGRRDLDLRLIRCVGEPTERFKEDSLRILRALRFAVTLGMGIERRTEAAIRSMAWTLDNLPAERVREELHRMFSFGWRSSMLILCNYPEVLFQLSNQDKLWFKPTLEDK